MPVICIANQKGGVGKTTTAAALAQGLSEYNKRVLSVSTSDENPITPKGGFKHYGEVKSDYIVVRGSVQGPPKRFVKLRFGIRLGNKKTQPPKILKISTVNTGENE